MTAYSGGLTQIKIGDGGVPVESFTTLSGIRVVQWWVEQSMGVAQDVQDSSWQVLQPYAARRMLRIDAEGVFSDSASEQALLTQLLAGTTRRYELHVPNGDGLRGLFAIIRYERTGERGEAERCRFSLESAGVLDEIE